MAVHAASTHGRKGGFAVGRRDGVNGFVVAEHIETPWLRWLGM